MPADEWEAAATMGLKGWVFLAEIVAGLGAVFTFVLGNFGWALGFGALLALAALISRALTGC